MEPSRLFLFTFLASFFNYIACIYIYIFLKEIVQLHWMFITSRLNLLYPSLFPLGGLVAVVSLRFKSVYFPQSQSLRSTPPPPPPQKVFPLIPKCSAGTSCASSPALSEASASPGLMWTHLEGQRSTWWDISRSKKSHSYTSSSSMEWGPSGDTTAPGERMYARGAPTEYPHSFRRVIKCESISESTV